MTDVRDLVAQASAYGLLLAPEGPHLLVKSVTNAPVPAHFRSVLVAQKAELLAFLAWQDAADQLLLDSTRSIGAEYPCGCPLDTDEWMRHDAALHVAYWSGDLAFLRRALAERERFALAAFAEYRAKTGRLPGADLGQ